MRGLWDLLRELARWSDNRGAPYAELTNQLAHAAAAFGPGAAFGALGSGIWPAAVSIGAVYFALKEWLLDRARGATLEDMLRDTLFVVLGAALGAAAASWAAVILWLALMVAAFHAALTVPR